MKKAELFEMAAETCRDILKRNTDVTSERIHNMFYSENGGTNISFNDAIGKATALSLTLVPEISAAVTAELLVRLGLVKLEDTE